MSPGMVWPPDAASRPHGALRRAWVDVDGTLFHMLVSTAPMPADTPAVVLVHGLGLSGRYMVPVAERLARHYRVYVPDLPGFGDSAKPARALDIPELADALADWMRAIGLDHAALLGNSQGCQVIVDLAERYPERVGRAVLQGPTTPPEERSWFRQFIRWRQNQPYNPRSMGPSTRGDYGKAGLRRVLRTFQYALDHHIEDRLPRVEAPVLVVRGGCDPICRQGWAERVARFPPRGHLVVIPGVAHTLVYTSPLELTRVTRPFIEPRAQVDEVPHRFGQKRLG